MGFSHANAKMGERGAADQDHALARLNAREPLPVAHAPAHAHLAQISVDISVGRMTDWNHRSLLVKPVFVDDARLRHFPVLRYGPRLHGDVDARAALVEFERQKMVVD